MRHQDIHLGRHYQVRLWTNIIVAVVTGKKFYPRSKIREFEVRDTMTGDEYVVLKARAFIQEVP